MQIEVLQSAIKSFRGMRCKPRRIGTTMVQPAVVMSDEDIIYELTIAFNRSRALRRGEQSPFVAKHHGSYMLTIDEIEKFWITSFVSKKNPFVRKISKIADAHRWCMERKLASPIDAE